MANVTPVLKKASKVDINNYRPVYMSAVAKVFQGYCPQAQAALYVLGGKSALTSRAVRISSTSRRYGCNAKGYEQLETQLETLSSATSRVSFSSVTSLLV